VELILIVLFGAVAAGAVAVVRSVRGAAARRTERVRAVADRIGGTFREKVPWETIPGLDRFELFRPGRSKRILNALATPPDGPHAVVFDYHYETGSGNSRTVHRQTVCYLVEDTLDLPSFSLRPERFYHRVAGVFGYADIDFDDRPEFSRLFLLRGDDEARIRRSFDGRVTSFFERRGGVCTAGVGRELLFWRPGRLIDASEYDALIADTAELAEHFVAAGATAADGGGG
jgi:hypothetical protein